MVIKKDEKQASKRVIPPSQKSSSGGKPKYIQSTLVLGTKYGSKIIRCTECGMTYSKQSHHDILIHTKFHELSIKGKKWSKKWGQEVCVHEPEANLTPALSQDNFSPENDKIVMIRPNHSNEVNATLEIMALVNNELNAPHDENKFWSEQENLGKAFVYVKDGKAVGAVTMEILANNRGRWMIYKNKIIVQNSRPQFKLGISRIWVCKSQRLRGIARKLLDTARQNTIRGEIVPKQLVAWSQPSDNGGKMALRYNSVKHGSGETLIPCYI